MLQYNIVIYTNHNYNEEDYNFNFQYEITISPQDIINLFISIVLLGWLNDNHFILLFPNDIPDNLIENVNKNIITLNEKNININKNNKISSKNESKIDNKNKEQINNDSDIKNYKEYLQNYI